MVAHNSVIKKTATFRRRRHLRAGAPTPHEQPTDVRLGRIVRLLMEHATVVVSGTKIAQEISSNRSEVWRLIQQLRGLGVDVAGSPGARNLVKTGSGFFLSLIFCPLVWRAIFS